MKIRYFRRTIGLDDTINMVTSLICVSYICYKGNILILKNNFLNGPLHCYLQPPHSTIGNIKGCNRGESEEEVGLLKATILLCHD